MKITKPPFVSPIELKTRPRIKAVCLSGKGDPALLFDDKLAEINSWLDKQKIKSIGPSFGVFYLSRDTVGVESVEWDACVPIFDKVLTGGNLEYKEFPETKVATVILTDNYNKIGEALDWMESTAKENNINLEWPLTEVYIKEGSDPITELQFLLSDEVKKNKENS